MDINEVRCKYCGGNTELLEEGNGIYRIKCLSCGQIQSIEDNYGQVVSERSLQLSGEQIFEKNINSVLEIRGSNKHGTWSGSGFIISSDGYAITNTHVVVDEKNYRPVKTLRARIPGREWMAVEVICIGDDFGGDGGGVDLALIRLKGYDSFAPITWGDSEELKIGSAVYVIGNSLGYGACITAGIVSDTNRYLNGWSPLIMTDAAINGGNSGGPMFNNKGEVVGVMVSSLLVEREQSAEGMNMSIPSTSVKQFLDDNEVL